MIIENEFTWTVTVTFPRDSLDAKGEKRRWAHNDSITVVASSLLRAHEMVMAQWPHVQVWSINHKGSRTLLMVDDLVAKAAT
jgi:hypothetical protein